MGAVVSCVRSCPLVYYPLALCARARSATNTTTPQIESIFRTIGNCIMAIVNGIASVLQSIIGCIANVFDIVISFLTCRRYGRRSRMGATTTRV